MVATYMMLYCFHPELVALLEECFSTTDDLLARDPRRHRDEPRYRDPTSSEAGRVMSQWPNDCVQPQRSTAAWKSAIEVVWAQCSFDLLHC